MYHGYHDRSLYIPICLSQHISTHLYQCSFLVVRSAIQKPHPRYQLPIGMILQVNALPSKKKIADSCVCKKHIYIYIHTYNSTYICIYIYIIYIHIYDTKTMSCNILVLVTMVLQ